MTSRVQHARVPRLNSKESFWGGKNDAKTKNATFASWATCASEPVVVPRSVSNIRTYENTRAWGSDVK